MPDREPIISLSVGMPDHEKIVRAGGDAAWLWICGLAYARRQHNDGVIPEGQVTRLSDRKQPRRLAQILVRERLWHGTGHDCPRCPVPMPGSYVIHDYADWQQLAVEEAADEEAEAATRIAKMQGGAYGNHRRWHLGRGRTEPGCPFCDALLMNGNGSYPSSDSDSHDPSDPDRICDPSTESVATRIPIGLAMTGPLSPPTPPPLPRVDITPLPPADAAAGQAVTDKPKRRRKAYDYGDDQDFLRFWEVFPQKSGKPKAYEAWLAALRRGADPEHVIAAAKHYADDPKRNPEKTKYPQGWLNDERYNDPVPDLNSSGYDNFWDQ